MSKEIFVNSDARETRIAVREDGKLVELHIEREERIVGSLYKGRVDNVVAGIDAAFIDIGLERNAFLYAGDIIGEDDAEGGDGGGFDRRGRRTRPKVPIRELVKRAFMARRKTLRNAWKGVFGLSSDELAARAQAADVSLDARGETLSVEDFDRMARGALSL